MLVSRGRARTPAATAPPPGSQTAAEGDRVKRRMRYASLHRPQGTVRYPFSRTVSAPHDRHATTTAAAAHASCAASTASPAGWRAMKYSRCTRVRRPAPAACARVTQGARHGTSPTPLVVSRATTAASADAATATATTAAFAAATAGRPPPPPALSLRPPPWTAPVRQPAPPRPLRAPGQRWLREPARGTSGGLWSSSCTISSTHSYVRPVRLNNTLLYSLPEEAL